MPRDTLSDLLRTLRLRGAVFYFVSCRDAWSAEAPPASEIAEAVMPGVEHVMEFHMVVKGSGWAAVSGLAPVQIGTGDTLMLPHGDAHVLSSAPSLEPIRMEADSVFATRQVRKPMPVAYHHGVVEPGARLPVDEASMVLVCGFFGCDLRPFNPLVAALPRLLHLPADQTGGWIGGIMDQAARKSAAGRPGADAVVERVAEMMFVDTARRYLDQLPEDATGWLAGLGDRYVGRALGLLHEHHTHHCTIEELGRAVGLSRSADLALPGRRDIYIEPNSARGRGNRGDDPDRSHPRVQRAGSESSSEHAGREHRAWNFAERERGSRNGGP